MNHKFKLARRMARFRPSLLAALAVLFAACDSTDLLTPDSPISDSFTADSLATADSVAAADSLAGLAVDDGSGTEEDTPVEEETPGDAPASAISLSIAYAGGIPIGAFHVPNDQFGSRLNGALRNIYPQYLLSNLRAIKARGGKVTLALSGGQSNFTDSRGNFSLTKWKAVVDRFKGVNFSSYINDGTIIGHYLIDEPSDRSNWNGKQVSPATIEAMAKYSKMRWPKMVTIVRDWPTYMASYSGSYTYLDAAWAQYRASKGSVSSVMSSNISAAKRKGLALIVGLNILKGGNGGGKMTASQVKSWGSTLLATSYPCAFISWKYDGSYMSRTDIKSAMSYLRSKAQNRSSKSCRGS
jgi:hypothetical protein